MNGYRLNTLEWDGEAVAYLITIKAVRNHLMSTLQYELCDNEISLVDLAATFVKRRHIFYVVFLVCTLAGVIYAFVTEETYQYTSLVQVAEASSDKFLELPETTIATLETRWLPEQEMIYQAENDEKLPFKTSFSHLENTGLIRIASESTEKASGDVEKIHQYLIDQIQQRHAGLLDREKRAIEGRIHSVDRSIEVLKSSQDNGLALAEVFDRRTKLQSDLDSLTNIETLVLARQSSDKVGPARSLIVALSALLGLIGGVASAFFAEFLALVRAQLARASEGGE